MFLIPHIPIAIGLLILGSDLAAIQGRFAEHLQLPGAVLIPWIPWISVLIYGVMVWRIRKLSSRLARVLATFTTCIVAVAITAYPDMLLRIEAVKIQLPARLDRDGIAAFKDRFHAVAVNYSSSGQGPCMMVSRAAYVPEMREFLTASAKDSTGK